MFIIGDVHGKYLKYLDILNDITKYTIKSDNFESIQIGDFGFKKQHDWFIDNIDYNKHKILFGNHDYYPYLKLEHSLGDYGTKNIIDINNNNKKIFWYRGSLSIDKWARVDGRDWFPNEEITGYEYINTIIDFYEKEKPDIVISHNCPKSITEYINGVIYDSLTNQVLESLFETHQPEKWIFGHHHKSINLVNNNTNFICLNELEVIKI